MKRRIKKMNVMKDLARRIVNLYVHKALWSMPAATTEFVQMHNQSAGTAGYTHLNAHAKFVHRFHAWSTKHHDSCMQDLQCMDDFFEQECGDAGYAWEDLCWPVK
jgi:hypothetical protein